MSQEIENAVTAILDAANITYNAVHRGLKVNPFGEKTGHSMDQWGCEFTNASKPKEPEEFDYFTGLGHRELPISKISNTPIKPKSWDNVQSPKELATWKEENKKPVAPHAAGVLYSLILDSSACEQSFESWCSDLCYDSDSRKAYVIYEACQKNADKLARVIPRAVLEQLREALQDY